jgi:predicted AlkP superfamily pyrophosphatase or phosphodiesterase
MRVRITLALAVLLAWVGTTAQERRPIPDRQRALAMFARAYYPGRSGQIMIVPREGSIVVARNEPEVKFMHGSPWQYDTRIPLLLYGPAYVRKGTYQAATRQQDVMPTVARVLDLPVPPTVTGRALVEAVSIPGATGAGAAGAARSSTGPPRIVVVAVLDAMRVDYFDRHASLMPTLVRLRREGAWFANTSVDYLPSVTGLGHATVATGTDPRYHGTIGNSMFDRTTLKAQDTFAGNSPRDLMALNLADAWNLHTRGRAVIVAQGSSVPAAVGLAGHGACLFGARPIRMASYSRQSGAWTSNDACYILPEYVKQRNAREVWERAGGRWMGHDITNADAVRRTSLFARFEADTLLSMIEEEAIGADQIADLVLVNLKTPDFVAHQYGPDSPELRETLAELDRQFGRLLEAIERKASGRYLIALTADHGMPGEPSGTAARVYTEDIIRLVHNRFDPEGKLVLHYENENSQLAIDVDRLTVLNHTLEDVVRLLEQQPFVFAAFTEDEVRRAAISLPRK